LKRESFEAKPSGEEGRQYHVRVRSGEVAPVVLLPGDPERIEKIKAFWSQSRELTRHRGYIVETGKIGPYPISVCSTGIGAPSTSIAVEELARCNCQVFIRVGSMGAIQPNIACGDLVIASAAVRLEGSSKQYVRPEYPAAADIETTMALIEATESLGFRYHVGYVASTDSFYCGQGREGFGGYWQSWMDDIIPDLRRARVLGFEMESSLLFVLSSLFGIRSGAIMAVFANRVNGQVSISGESECAKVACEAVKILYEKGTLKKA